MEKWPVIEGMLKQETRIHKNTVILLVGVAADSITEIYTFFMILQYSPHLRHQ